jgi:hypothetical protein
VNVVVGIGITLAVTAVAVAALLLVRRRAPEGSYFSDGDRASGVFGVLATGFAVVLGFIVFLAFTSYDQSRSGAETEATVLAQQVETAQLMPPSARDTLTGQLVCYGRSVIAQEWPAMEAGTIGDRVNPWGLRLFATIRTVVPRTASEQSAFDQWLSQTQAREQARLDRVHGAAGIIPAPVWIVLFVISGLIFAYMLFFADSAERAVTQGMLIGCVTATITVLLLLLSGLDHPFSGDVGGLQPAAMERSLRMVDDGLAALSVEVHPPCDGRGAPTAG